MKKEYDFSKGKRGPVIPLPSGKLRITIRLDQDVLEWFKARVDAAGGGNYQTMMNDALRIATACSPRRTGGVWKRPGREAQTDSPMNDSGKRDSMLRDVPLRDLVRFREVFVDREGGTIAWPNEVDLAPEVLYSMVSGRMCAPFRSS
jgi:hypothetical protein